MTNGEKFKEVFKDTIADVGYDGLTNITKVSIFHNHYVLYFLKGWWNAEYKERITKNDLALLRTEGLDEEIRCTMCTNYMKSDRGCDGSCVVDKDMYKAVMDAIEKRIHPTTKNDLGVDCISRAEVLKLMKDNWHTHNGDWAMQESMDDIRALPSVTPQEPILDKIFCIIHPLSIMSTPELEHKAIMQIAEMLEPLCLPESEDNK